MEFFIDENGEMVREPITTDELCHFANAFQRAYFPMSDPDVDVCLCNEPGFLKAAAFDHTQKTIFISERLAAFHELAKVALLHELIHVNLFTDNGDVDKEHGERFIAEIRRLRDMGAYDPLL